MVSSSSSAHGRWSAIIMLNNEKIILQGKTPERRSKYLQKIALADCFSQLMKRSCDYLEVYLESTSLKKEYVRLGNQFSMLSQVRDSIGIMAFWLNEDDDSSLFDECKRLIALR